MNRNYRRFSAAALVFVFCISAAPVVSAKAAKDRDRIDPGDPIVRIVKKIKSLLGRISSLDEFPGPPVP